MKRLARFLRAAIPPAGAAAMLLVATLTGCVTPKGVLDTPTGFAPYRDGELYTIVSPEHVVARVRTAGNDPAQSLEFWAQALKRHLSLAGYALTGDGAFESPAGDGVYFEWVAPVGREDFGYLTAIAVAGEAIIIVEAAGPYELYRTYRERLAESLSTLALRDRL
jgi:hypothetical protein